MSARPCEPVRSRALAAALLALALLDLGALPAASAAERRNWVVIPALGYSSDTAWMGGGMLMRLYGCGADEAEADCRRSQLSLAFLYSQKQQLVARLAGDNAWSGRRHRLVWNLSYRRFPSTFYGIGREADLDEGYTPLGTALELSYLRRLGAGWELGLAGKTSRQRLEDVDAGGSLAAGTLPGSQAHTLVGLGPRVILDRRDSTWYPRRGVYLIAAATLYRRALGGDLDAEHYGLDLRAYRSLAADIVLAGQLALDDAPGATPFQLLPALGGDEVLRGYPDRRYRDRSRLLAQLELRRAALLGRLGAAAFISVGDVAPSPQRLLPGQARVGGGLGLRYLYDRASGLALRLDYGVGEGGASGIAVTLGEAF